jgi:hypothetical protein
MRFSALLSVLAGLCSISNAVADFSSASRQVEPDVERSKIFSNFNRDISLKERVPVHPRDFSIEKRDTELEIGDVGSDATQIAAVGVNGCTGTFIWAGGLVFGAHTECDEETVDMKNLQDAVTNAGFADQVTSVAICYPQDQTDGLQEIKDGLAWTKKNFEVTTYPYDPDVDNVIFTLTAKTANPGQVTVDKETI